MSVFGEDQFHMYLAYHAGLFEALLRLNNKMQVTGSNINEQTDIINYFKAKLDFWIQQAKKMTILDNFTAWLRLFWTKLEGIY